jgi:hypothetical protein
VPFIASETLSVLELRNNRIRDLPPSLTDLYHLTHLELEGNQITILPLKALAAMHSLDTLHVGNNPLEDRAFGPKSSSASNGVRNKADAFRNPKSADLLKWIAKEYCGYALVGEGGHGGFEFVVEKENEEEEDVEEFKRDVA